MDLATIGAYDRDPAGFADDWESQPPPTDLHDAVRRCFLPGQPTADIGCGSGRDTAWLNGNGYPAQGFDASQGLLAEARRRHPGIGFATAVLPELAAIPPASFANLLCETVIMHLPPASVAPATRRLLDILRPGGVLYLSWRIAEAERRDAQGRLYAAFDPSLVRDALAGTDILLDEQRGSLSSGRPVHRLVVRRLSPATASPG